MTVKNISIMSDVYRTLLTRKKANESFSDLLRRSFKAERDIMDFAGAWKDMSDEDIDEIKENIKKIREKSKTELAGRIKGLNV
ncbi:MAG: antitoxin VapB family protein [Nanoarchaeota archaeon]